MKILKMVLLFLTGFWALPQSQAQTIRPSQKVDKICPLCFGYGHTTCTTCSGRGSKTETVTVYDRSSAGDTRKSIEVSCNSCAYMGRRGRIMCWNCNGRGKVK
jgi:DnaJ-class molecular chaperone